MTWTKLSDDYGDECWTLSDGAFRLLTELLIFSNRKLLNCIVPKEDFVRFAKRPEALEELVRGGWCIDRGNSVEIVYHATYQRDRDTQVAIQKRNEANGKKGGRPRKPTPANPTGNPSGLPDGNPKGLDGTGLVMAAGSQGETIADEVTGEVFDWPTVDIPARSDPGYCRVCGGPSPCEKSDKKHEAARAA